MNILTLSDSHGSSSLMSDVINILQDEIDMVLFMGDCVDDFMDFEHIFPEKKFHYVSGNCDFNHREPSERLIEVAGKKIFLTHGHNFGVKAGHIRLMAEALRRKANICLYGHSHSPAAFLEQGIYFMNPGSISLPRDCDYPTFGVINVENDAVRLSIMGVQAGKVLTHFRL